MRKIATAAVALAATMLAAVAATDARPREASMEDYRGDPISEYGVDSVVPGRIIVKNKRSVSVYLLGDWGGEGGRAWAMVPAGKRAVIYNGYGRDTTAWIYDGSGGWVYDPKAVDAYVYDSGREGPGEWVYLTRKLKKDGTERELLPRKWRIVVR